MTEAGTLKCPQCGVELRYRLAPRDERGTALGADSLVIAQPLLDDTCTEGHEDIEAKDCRYMQGEWRRIMCLGRSA
jgi:hypothetical protein